MQPPAALLTQHLFACLPSSPNQIPHTAYTVPRDTRSAGTSPTIRGYASSLAGHYLNEPASRIVLYTDCPAAGLVGLAGNWAGQGGTLAFLFSGQSLFDSRWLPESASAWETWPASYMQLADPAVFGNKEVLLQATVHGIRLSSLWASLLHRLK